MSMTTLMPIELSDLAFGKLLGVEQQADAWKPLVSVGRD
jgi:hypothetical protein